MAATMGKHEFRERFKFSCNDYFITGGPCITAEQFPLKVSLRGGNVSNFPRNFQVTPRDREYETVFSEDFFIIIGFIYRFQRVELPF